MKVAFRMEGSHVVGTGHVMRCLTLARILRARGHDVHFLCSRETAVAVRHAWPGAVCHLLPRDLPELQDGAVCGKMLSRLRPDWLVVDGYGFSAAWERMVKPYCGKLLAIDDVGRAHAADVVLDSALEGTLRYRGKIGVGAQAWFGPRYALLRQGIASTRARGERVFVSFGGADPAGMSLRVANLLFGNYAQVDVVVGYAYQGKEALAALVAQAPGWRLYVNHKAPERLMRHAKLAVGAGGGMTWERCAIGLPSVVVSIADNQVGMSEALAAQGAISYAGKALQVKNEA
ncbi:MAG: UDP-2,4-diacetamido-2,4,6-trideoxy-beta-L-altropyranose hydrolase, partial [Rickettsiales bacterium]|nr:UDP-2,4-diacetamido-2,4,6-trideoxy-beta-L-altropyranose hydrolase [Rickettsiales bacterium]